MNRIIIAAFIMAMGLMVARNPMLGADSDEKKASVSTDSIASVITSEPTKEENPTEQEKKNTIISYRLPESTEIWRDPWMESEVNLVCVYTSEVSLTEGSVTVTLCIPELTGIVRVDDYELTIHAFDDFMNWSGDHVRIVYEDGGVKAEGKEMKEAAGYKEVVLSVEYNSSQLRNGKELNLIFKSHCEQPEGAYEVMIKEITVTDASAGSVVVDVSKENVSLEGKMYLTGETVPYTISDGSAGFYVKNGRSKMAIGDSYPLMVYGEEEAGLTYRSTDVSIVSVDETGLVTSHKEGICEIIVTKVSTGEEKRFGVTVSRPRILGEEYEVFMLSGSRKQFRFYTEYKYGEEEFSFRSERPEVASVTEDGMVTAHKAGTTVITVTDRANEAEFSFDLLVYTPEDPDGIARYLSIDHTGYVTPDIAKRSYEILYDVYKNVFDYFNDGVYEEVTLHFTKNDYSPAYSDSRDVYLASEHMLANAKDVDCITHELIHCAQNHISVGEYVWLMEGLTDYGRYLFGLHNEDCGWSLAEYHPGQQYTDGYTVTASFLKYVTDNYCEELPHVINRMFKEPGGYDDTIWEENTSYTLEKLWELYCLQSL